MYKNGYISEWEPIENLRRIDENISEYVYHKEFAENLELKKYQRIEHGLSGELRFLFEYLEVKEDNGNVYYRENSNRIRPEIPELFNTQLGVFENHNHGEFFSYLEKKDKDFFVRGNFQEMFDCGEYTYAVSNLLHGGSILGIIRIDHNYEFISVFDNIRDMGLKFLEYLGKVEIENGYLLFVNGDIRADRSERFHDVMYLLRVDRDNGFSMENEWNCQISNTNSVAIKDEYVYFGHNKMVSRLNISTGDVAYFTNKSDEALAALVRGQ